MPEMSSSSSFSRKMDASCLGMTSWNPRRNALICVAIDLESLASTTRATYSALFSFVRKMLSPPSLSGTTFSSPNSSHASVNGCSIPISETSFSSSQRYDLCRSGS
eukprot:Amastigsp_a676276_35.p5 type:complete len:106 gc:universal Amastigsp_a676276_35:400-83(-)